MIEETLYRVISLALLMIGVGAGWYKFKLISLKGDESAGEEIKEQVKREALRYSVVVGFILMVIVLGIHGHFL